MSADLHMAEDLKTASKANLFIITGETEIDLVNQNDVRVRVKVNRVDVFKPQTGEVVRNGADGIACRCIDTDCDEESFFVRHTCFLGASDPYGSLKAMLKAEIGREAWSSLNSDTSLPFTKRTNGRITVQANDHLGGELTKVFRVQ